MVITGAVRHSKSQSKYHQQTNTKFLLQARCPSRHPTRSVEALKGNLSSSLTVKTVLKSKKMITTKEMGPS